MFMFIINDIKNFIYVKLLIVYCLEFIRILYNFYLMPLLLLCIFIKFKYLISFLLLCKFVVYLNIFLCNDFRADKININ